MRCWSNYVLEPFWPQLAPTELAPFVEWRCLASYPKLAGLLLAGDTEKTPILALHGWLDNAGSMQALLAHLHGQLGATALALDLPGHGCSEHTAAQHHAPFVDYVDAVLHAMDSANFAKVDLIGHSMGGGIACLFAAAFPERVRRLILLDSIGPLSGDVEKTSSELRRGILARRSQKTPPAYASPFDALAARDGAFGIESAQAKPIVQRGLMQSADGLYRWRNDPRLLQASPMRFAEAQVLALLHAIAAPVLLVLAKPRTAFLQATSMQHRLDCIAQLELLEVEGNHHLHVLPSAELVDTVVRFLIK
jgi:pimeloyl-ACP methyl ester carboxylesterase